MKLFLLAACVLGWVWSAHPQGQLIFANSSKTLITNHVTGLPAPGGPEQNDTQVGLYVGNVGDSVWSLTLIGNATNCFLPGRFSGGTRTLAGWTGTVQLQVRAWLASTVYPSYEAATAAGFGGDSSVRLGASMPFNMALTIPPTPPKFIAVNGLGMIIIPEPSTMALALIGLGSLLLLIRPRARIPLR